MINAFIDELSFDFRVHLLPCREDNYTFLLEKNKTALLIDCADPVIVENYLNEKGFLLEKILITHHHPDHIDGIESLAQKYNCPIYCSDVDDKRQAVPSAFLGLKEKDTLTCFNKEIEFQILETFGHTAGHISYYSPKLHLIFCGDTLFSLGCGRVFPDGNLEKLHLSLNKVASLPEQTQVYCAHEYTLSNAQFLLKSGKISSETLEEVKEKLRLNKRTIPTIIKYEKDYNPFINPSLEEFINLRTLKDRS